MNSLESEIEPETGTETETAAEPLLKATDLQKYFETETGLTERILGNQQYVKAVDGVDLSIDRQETVGVVGESGCGKTTLGRTLSKLYEPTGGTIEFDGEDITDLSSKELRELRSRIQVIFQDPLSSLNPRKTVGEILGKPLEIHDIATGEAKRERVAELLEEVGLQPSHASRYPHEFSGGQRQRIGIARAISIEPDLIIADEPVSALDVSVQAQIINMMKRLQRKYDLSYVFIAHDLSVVKHISDRVMVMYLGNIVEQGPKDAIFNNPQHPYTRALLSSIPTIDETPEKRRTALQGTPPSPIDPPSGCPFSTRCPEYIGPECSDEHPELETVADKPGSIDAPEDVPTILEEYESPESHHAACHWLERSGDERWSHEAPAIGERGE